MTVDAEALKCLKEYHFPGNVRELRNILEHAVPLADDDTIGPEHLPDECRCESTNGKLSAPGSLDEIIPLNQLEGRYIQKVLAHYHGDRKSLAEKLGISERTLYRKLEALRGEVIEIENLT